VSVGRGLLYAAAVLVAGWGVAHLLPTRAVLAGFGPISADNRRVLTMEWVAEGLTMIFVGVLVAAVTAVDAVAGAGARDSVAVVVYRASAGLLAAIAVLTALTGARTPVAWFKACPLVMATGIVLLLTGSAL
jgi:hypothetical protein